MSSFQNAANGINTKNNPIINKTYDDDKKIFIINNDKEDNNRDLIALINIIIIGKKLKDIERVHGRFHERDDKGYNKLRNDSINDGNKNTKKCYKQSQQRKQ